MVHIGMLCGFAELVRSLHVYRLKDGKEKEVEREFVFSVDGPYVEMKAGPILRLRRFQVLELFEGQVIGLWRCIFAFHVNNPHLSHSSFLLSVSRYIPFPILFILLFISPILPPKL